MARDKANPCEVDQEKYDADDNVKIICLGDSAVGKSKYVGKLGEKGRAQSGSELSEVLWRHSGAQLVWKS